MHHRRRASLVSMIGSWILIWIAAMGCQTPLEPTRASFERPPPEWLPIIDEEPLPPGDIRHLQNCAEYPFQPPLRGPWDSIESKDLADRGGAIHSTSDQVVDTGEPASLQAEMKYKDGALNREWVRLFIGSCDGWSQVGVRKTDEDGQVVFRLPHRQAAGIYGVIFQVVGDGTMTRAQLWIVSTQTEVVAFDLEGAAFEPDTDMNNVVEGAPLLSRWNAQQGRLVTYIAREADELPGLQIRREKLRAAGFAVGPVVKVSPQNEQESATTTDRLSTESDGWGQAGNQHDRRPALSTQISNLYAENHDAADIFRRVGISASETFFLDSHCRRGDENEVFVGWECLLSELFPDDEDDDPG